MPKKANPLLKRWREKCRRQVASLKPATRKKIVVELARPSAEEKQGGGVQHDLDLVARKCRVNRDTVLAVMELTKPETLAKAAAMLRFPTQPERQRVLSMINCRSAQSFDELAASCGCHPFVIFGIYEMNTRTILTLRKESL